MVLLPVNPYLAHVYWGIARDDLEEIGRIVAGPDPQAQPVLRFYDVGDIDFDGTNARGWFDVEIDLRAGNWYVHLQSPAKSYCIDLGLRIRTGGFHRLARSNVAEIPPAGPSDKIEERFLPVEGDHPRVEPVLPPLIELAEEAAKILRERSEAGDLRRTAGNGPEPKELRIYRTVAPGEIERRVAEVYEQRIREWSDAATEEEHTGKPQPPAKAHADLTEMSEKSFRTDTLTGRTTSPQGPTETRDPLK